MNNQNVTNEQFKSDPKFSEKTLHITQFKVIYLVK